MVGGELADDVVQSVFLRVLGLRRSSLKSVEDPAAWLCTLTRNAALNMQRTGTRAKRREASAMAPTATEPTGLDDLERVLDVLPQPQREALVLRHSYGFTLERLAGVLGVSRSTAAERYAKGLALAREQLTAPSSDGVTQHVG